MGGKGICRARRRRKKIIMIFSSGRVSVAEWNVVVN